MAFHISVLNGNYNGFDARGRKPAIVRENGGLPPQALIDAAVAQGNGFYEVLANGTLGPKLASIPAPTLTVREVKIDQAYTFLRTYAQDFILGNQTPTNAQRNNALDALIAITLLEKRND